MSLRSRRAACRVARDSYGDRRRLCKRRGGSGELKEEEEEESERDEGGGEEREWRCQLGLHSY